MPDLGPLSDTDAVETVLTDGSRAMRDGLLVALASRRGCSTAEIAAVSGLSVEAVELWLEVLTVDDPSTETDDADDGSDDRSRFESVDVAVRSFVRAETIEGITEMVADVTDEFFDTTAVAVYRYDGLRSELVPEIVTPDAEARFEIEPIAEGIDPWWSAFRTNEPTAVENGLVVPSEALGIVRLGDVDVDAVTEADVRTFRPIATAAVGAAERRRRIESLENDRAELKRKNENLQDFANIVSHDLRNPLSVAEGYLELAVETGDEEHVQEVKDAHQRIERIIEHTLTLARQGQQIDDAEPVELESVARRAWGTVETAGATLRVTDSTSFEADPDRLQQLLENLFRNSVEHGSTSPDDSLVVTVGTIDDGDGFFVADDGPGIPESDRSRIFERGYTDSDDGTGFGLHIVREIADAHRWDISVSDSDRGGARFEIDGV